MSFRQLRRFPRSARTGSHASVVRDIGRRRPADEDGQREQLEALGRVVAGAAHDLNNLLTIISGYSTLLLADPEAPSKDDVAEIARAAEAAASLTRQLLALSDELIAGRANLER